MVLIDEFRFITTEVSLRKTKQDFIDYCTDLHRLEFGLLNFSVQTGFSFAELLELSLVIKKSIVKWFLESDVIVVGNAVYEYDPDYSHIVPYIINKFNLKSEVLAISSPKDNLLDNARHILSAYLSNGGDGLIVIFEQAILPLCINSYVKSPEYSSVSVLKFAGS